MAVSWSSATWALPDLVTGVKSSFLVWSSLISFVIPINQSNSLLTSNKEKYYGWSVRHVVLHEDSIKTTGIQREGMSMILFILRMSVNRTLAWRKANMIWFRTFLLEAMSTLGNGRLIILKDLRKKGRLIISAVLCDFHNFSSTTI